MATGEEFQLSPLFNAVDRDMPDRVAELLRCGADPNALNPRTGEPPIFLALERSPLVLDALLAGGADPNFALADEGETPVFVAVLAQDVKMVERLIAGGARMMVEEKRGYTPLKLAEELGDPWVLEAVERQLAREKDDLAYQATAMEKSVPAMRTLKFRMGAP